MRTCCCKIVLRGTDVELVLGVLKIEFIRATGDVIKFAWEDIAFAC
jgi:hypothetical protein